MYKQAQPPLNPGVSRTFAQVTPGGGRPVQGPQQPRSPSQLTQQPQQQRPNPAQQTQQTLAQGQRAQPGQVPTANQPQPQPPGGQQPQGQQPQGQQPQQGGFDLGGMLGNLGGLMPRGEGGFGQMMGMLMPFIQPLLGAGGLPAMLAMQQLYRGATGGFQNNPNMLFQKTSARKFGEKLGHKVGQRLQMRRVVG